MESKQQKTQYINHYLNYSPSKAAYTFPRKGRFQGQNASNQNYSILAGNNSSTKEGMPNEKKNRKEKQLQQGEYFEYGFKKKDDYKIFPVRKDITHLIKQMQELRTFFKTNLQRKKYDKRQKKEQSTKYYNQRSESNWRQNTNKGSVNREKAKSTHKFDSSSANKKISSNQQQPRLLDNSLKNELKNPENSSRKSLHIKKYISSNYRNTVTYSFGTSPKKIAQGIKTQQNERNPGLYLPFSQFGN